jgi:hypothetical protein
MNAEPGAPLALLARADEQGLAYAGLALPVRADDEERALGRQCPQDP